MAQGVSNVVLVAQDILNIEVIACQVSHPPLLTTVQFQLCQDVSQIVIVCPDCELMAI